MKRRYDMVDPLKYQGPVRPLLSWGPEVVGVRPGCVKLSDEPDWPLTGWVTTGLVWSRLPAAGPGYEMTFHGDNTYSPAAGSGPVGDPYFAKSYRRAAVHGVRHQGPYNQPFVSVELVPGARVGRAQLVGALVLRYVLSLPESRLKGFCRGTDPLTVPSSELFAIPRAPVAPRHARTGDLLV